MDTTHKVERLTELVKAVLSAEMVCQEKYKIMERYEAGKINANEYAQTIAEELSTKIEVNSL